MPAQSLNNVNIQSITLLPTPREIRQQFQQTAATRRTVARAREAVERILDREDPRMLAIVGPCSIHDLDATMEYATRLKELADKIQDSVVVIMRVYFEKPRTTVGWKGFINDPTMDDTFRMDEGLRRARKFLLALAEMGLPAATEALDPITPQYIGDLIAWTAIGARTAESQTHRELASGLSMPVGFKNSMDGGFTSAINAIKAALQPHHFFGITELGRPAVFGATGNPYPHLVLRGGAQPNYDPASVVACEKALQAAGLPVRIMVDCSHGNSNKDPGKQGEVLGNVMEQIEAGNQSLVGIMLESNLEWGSQPMAEDPANLKYGVSITDACIDWATTETLLTDLHDRYAKLMETRFHGH
ncbi:MAG: 3-deoxy-7-phosphoheptulonate synthase [Kiritimatiellia bacterium]